MSEMFKAGSPVFSTPVPVIIAGIAIIATRCLSVLLLLNELGWQETINFIHRSAQAWDSTLIFITGQLLFFVELRCAIVLMRGSNSGRWGYVFIQLLILIYMLMASFGWVYPEIFSISGENIAQIIHRTLIQKLPDAVVLLLLFVPASSRAFFAHR